MVSQRGNIAWAMPFDGLADAFVQPGAAQPGQAAGESVAHEGVGKPDTARCRFGDQAAVQAGLDRVHDYQLIGAGHVHEHIDR